MGLGNVREQPPRIHIDGMPTGWLNNGHVGRLQLLRQIPNLPCPIREIDFIQRLVQPHRHGVQVAPRQAPIGGESFAQNQFLLCAFVQRFIVHRQKAANVDDRVFFGAHRCAVSQREHFTCNLNGCFVGIARFALFDEPGVFGKPTRINEKWNAIFVIHGGHFAQVLHRNRLATARIVGDGNHAKGDTLNAGLFNEAPQFVHIHVALEGVCGLWVAGFVNHQVHRFSAARANVAFGGIKMHVRGDFVARLDEQLTEDMFSGAPLVCRHEEAKAENIANGVAQTIE